MRFHPALIPMCLCAALLVCAAPAALAQASSAYSLAWSSLSGGQSGAAGGSYVLEVRLTGITGLTPATGVSSVSLNVTATNPVDPGFVTVYPCGTKPPTSNVNFLAGQTVANAVVTSLSSSGTVCFASSVDTDLVVDINGWFA